MLENIPLTLRVIAGLMTVVIALISLLAAINKFKTTQKRKLLVESEYTDKFLGQFNTKEIEGFLSGYVAPNCSPTDPNNKDGEGYLADTREPIFDYMDRNIEIEQRGYHLILADTGMGKTMFCLNYFAHLRKKHPDKNVCLISLSSPSSEQQISRIVNKSQTILIADAFDEDPKSLGRGRDRLMELLNLCADFRFVIITCRSQFFMSDDAIPRETPLPILLPRQLGQGPTFSLVRSFISPFGPKEIDRYLRKHFPIWAVWRISARQHTMALIKSVPDLVHRPMLLERLPELAKTTSNTREVYELYDLLVEGWLKRESRWIALNDLRTISIELALKMYGDFQDRQGRIRPEEINLIANKLDISNPDWEPHLTSRSLLNRDSRGNYKFAHKSILEFLVVKATIEGDDRGMEFSWTPFMKEMFISWGHSDAGSLKYQRAKDILSSEEGRKSIAPLFDMHGTTAVRGLPNFKRAFERKVTSTGDRFSPATWRESSITIFRKERDSEITIVDHEFNLTWQYLPNQYGTELPALTLLDALKADATDAHFKFPSLEQFLTLVQGLHYSGRSILQHNAFYLLADKPEKHIHLVVQLNCEPSANPALKLVDRMRVLSGTTVQVNSYLTGTPFGSDYASKLIVDQLRIRDVRANLLL